MYDKIILTVLDLNMESRKVMVDNWSRTVCLYRSFLNTMRPPGWRTMAFDHGGGWVILRLIDTKLECVLGFLLLMHRDEGHGQHSRTTSTVHGIYHIVSVARLVMFIFFIFYFFCFFNYVHAESLIARPSRE